ncbi:unannotated protein [freshwater metagenome]|uniref:Unannotated protein n=1 Tax=freshwater metagenome TaxID=449393 RepID=A0A6J7C264_9ZZZZ
MAGAVVVEHDPHRGLRTVADGTEVQAGDLDIGVMHLECIGHPARGQVVEVLQRSNRIAGA